MNKKLKPCPFCGGEAVIKRVPIDPDVEPGYVAGCRNCHFDLEGSRILFTESEAVEAWNRRAEADHIRDATKMTERTAKAEPVEADKAHVYLWKCGNCGQYTHGVSWSRNVKYCNSCGARLEWE